MMKIILIYISKNFKHKQFIEKNFNNIIKIYETNFANISKEILCGYEYFIYLNDETNYNYDCLTTDIDNALKILKNEDDNQIQQILFDNYNFANIEDKILNKDYTHFYNEITIFKNTKPKKYLKTNNTNYINYVNNNFNRLFIPSIIKTLIFNNYDYKLLNNPHNELIFLQNIDIKRYILNNEKNLIIYPSHYNNIPNINNDLTIVTGYIKLNEKKIQKYAKQTYEYLDSSIDTLKININMVIYVSEEIYEFVYNKRKEYNLLDKTKIIKIDIEKHMYFYDKLHVIEENVKKNHVNYSSAKKILSVVSRYNYLKDTIENNYFNSKYFAWLDFGAGHIVSIPNDIIFKDNFDNKVKIGWVGRYYSGKFIYNYKMLAGGFFIGCKNAILELIQLHNIYFEKLMNYGFTINDDKLLFFIYEANPYLFKTYFTDYTNIIVKTLL